MKRTLRVLLLLRYPTSNSLDLISALEHGLDCAEGHADIAVHWSYPIHPLLGDSSSRADTVVARLKARSKDRILPIGFTGAYHSILQVDELRKELQWSSRNPWHEDLKTAFGSEAISALFPLSVDLARAQSRSVYADGPRLLALDQPNGELIAIDGEGLTSIPFLSSTRYDSRKLAKELLRHYRREESDRVAIDINAFDTRGDRLGAVFATVAGLQEKWSGLSIGTVDELPTPSDGQADELVSLALRMTAVPNDPVSRSHRLLEPKKKRGRKRGVNELMKQRLARLAVVDPGEAQTERNGAKEPRVDDRTLIADMSGIVTLAEPPLSARFEAGRLAGMAHGQTHVGIEQPSRSYLRFGGRSREFTTVSTFSFEGDRCRGLRTIQTFRGDGVGQPGQLVGDYYFEEGQTDLLATITVTYPEVRGVDRVEEYAVLELPLFSTGSNEEVEVEAEYPGGERYAVRLRPKLDPFQLCGQQFCFRGRAGEFRLRFPDLQNAVPEAVEARFRKSGVGFTLCISPRSSYAPAPAEAFTGIVEQFRLAISVEPNSTHRDPATDRNPAPKDGQK